MALSRNETNVFLAAILETLHEASRFGVPSGHLYAGLMGQMSLDDYNTVIALGKGAGLFTLARSHVLTITDKGHDVHAKVSEIRVAARAADGRL